MKRARLREPFCPFENLEEPHLEENQIVFVLELKAQTVVIDPVWVIYEYAKHRVLTDVVVVNPFLNFINGSFVLLVDETGQFGWTVRSSPTTNRVLVELPGTRQDPGVWCLDLHLKDPHLVAFRPQ